MTLLRRVVRLEYRRGQVPRSLNIERNARPRRPQARKDVEVPGALEEVMIEGSSPALTYYRGGSDGPPLVLLNALGHGIEPWSPLVERLLPRRIVLWEMQAASVASRPHP